MRAARRPLLAAALLLALAPAEAAAVTIFGLVDTGELYASADGGASWAIRSTLPVRDAVALVAGETSTRLYMASASGSFHRSADGGATWSAVGAIPAADVAALATDPGGLLLFTRSGGVYGSTDQGATWAAVGAITAPDVTSATRAGAASFALTRSGTVHRSLDGGASWSAVGAIAAANAVEIAALGSDLYVLTETGEVARSDDDGLGWSFVGTLSQVGMSGMLATGAELLATTVGGEVAASAAGATWTWRGAIGQLDVIALGSDAPTATGVGALAPRAFALAPPWPNPARGETRFALELERPAAVTAGVYDAAGRLVARPIAGEPLPAGRTVRAWDPGGLASGVYFLRARVGGVVRSRPIVWLGGR